ncbi:MAG: Dabb family protein [Gammaproteobacteria bacterium]|nr:Dabb family protein [Gammaproteobacteria bacterium]
MVKHCVFIKFLPEITEAQRESLYQAIYNLRHHLPGWQNFSFGSNVTPETGMDKGFNGGFIIDFADEAARNSYLADKQHQEIGAQIVKSTVGGVDGIMVFDFLDTLNLKPRRSTQPF